MADTVIHGSFSHLYSSASYDALPLWPIVLIPAVAVMHALGLRTAPGAVPPAAWVVVPYTLAVGIVVAHSTRRLVWDLGLRRRVWTVQSAVAVAVVFPCAVGGHMEDALAFAFLAYGLRQFRRGEIDRAAVFLGLAITSKQWALLVVPAMTVASGPRKSRFAFLSMAVPTLFAVLSLGLDYDAARRQLLAPSALVHYRFVHQGVSAWLGARGSRLVRPIELAATPIIALWARRYGRSILPMVVVGMLMMRPLLEPVLYSYYLSPVIALLVILGAAGTSRSLLRWLAPAMAVTFWSLYAAPSPWLWWPIELALLLATITSAHSSRTRVRLGPEPDSRSEAERTILPMLAPAPH